MKIIGIIMLSLAMASSGCIITSQRVAGRRSAMRIAPMVVEGAPGIAAAFGDMGEWTTGEMVVGGVETAGWVGIAAVLYELNRKANSNGGGREPTVIQHTYSGNNTYIGGDAGTVSTRRDAP